MTVAGAHRRAAGAGPVAFGVALTVAVHIAFGAAFVSATPGSFGAAEGPAAGAILCHGMRCPMLPAHAGRRDPERLEAPPILEAMIVPKLGLKEKDTRYLPRIQKYEQPEKVEKAVNIARENPEPKVIPKAPKPKPEERDRRPRRKKRDDSLAALLGVVQDDPRAMATDLTRIVGRADGSVHGSGTERREGNLYAAKVEVAVRRQFRVPQALSDKELRKLSVQILVSRIGADGSIEAHRIKKRSGNRAFDAAALAAIQRFVPSEGGSQRLPKPDADALDQINRRGFLLILDGREL